MSKDPSFSPMEEIATPSGRIVRKEEFHEEVIAKRLKHSVDLQAEEITQEENQLLNSNNWYHVNQHPIVSRMPSQLYYNCTLAVVREAYLLARKTQDDIIDVLKDDNAHTFLFQLAFCLSCMKEASLSLREIRASLSTRTNLDYHKCTTDVHVQADSAVSSNPSHLKKCFQLVDHLDSSPKPKDVDNKGGDKCRICTVKDVESAEATRQTGTLNTVEKFLFRFEDEIVKLLGQRQKEDSDNVSNKIYHISLVLKEIVTQMKIHPEVSEGNEKNTDTTMDAQNVGKVSTAEKLCPQSPHDPKDRLKAEQLVREMERGQAKFQWLIEDYFKSFQKKFETKGFMKPCSVDNRTATLMAMVEAGVSKLNTEIKQEESLLIQLMDNVCDSYACDTKEYGYAVDSEEQRKMLTEQLQWHINISMNCLSNNTNQKMYMTFRKLIELFEPCIMQSSV